MDVIKDDMEVAKVNEDDVSSRTRLKTRNHCSDP